MRFHSGHGICAAAHESNVQASILVGLKQCMLANSKPLETTYQKASLPEHVHVVPAVICISINIALYTIKTILELVKNLKYPTQ